MVPAPEQAQPTYFLPDTPEFRDLLGALSFERPAGAVNVDEALGAPASEAIGSATGGGLAARDYQEVRLYAPRFGKANLPWLISAVRRELKRRGHVETEGLAGQVVSMFVLHPQRRRDPVSVLTRLLRSTCPCGLNQYVVTPAAAPEGFELSMKPFWLGPLNAEQLRYQTERAGGDYFSRYGDSLRGQLVIKREPREVVALPVHLMRDLVPEPLEVNKQRLLYSLVDRYFGELGRVYMESFWREFRDVQWLTAATGAPYVDPRVFRERINGLRVINVFLRFPSSGRGWVAPEMPALAWDLGPAMRLIPPQATMLETAYAAGVAGPSEFLNVARTVCKFILRAIEHEADARMDEAFLSHVIALDLVFGEKDSLTRSIAERVAVLLGPAQGDTAAERKAHVGDLYAARSNYVHKGEACSAEDLEAVKLVTRTVVHALMRMASLPDSVRPTGLAKWLEKLDAVWAATKAGVALPSAELANAGIEVGAPPSDVA